MVYGFSNKEEVYKDVSDISLDASDYNARSLSISIEKNGSFMVENVLADRNSLVAVVDQFHQDISPEVRNRIMNIHVTSDYKVSEADTWFLFESLKPYGFHRMVTPNEEIVKSKGNTTLLQMQYGPSLKYDIAPNAVPTQEEGGGTHTHTRTHSIVLHLLPLVFGGVAGPT